MTARLPAAFFRRNVLTVAPELLGKTLVRKFDNDTINKYVITEIEAYNGYEDLACHASKGRTPRTDIMFREGGLVYVFLVYGIHWMLNFVTGTEGEASAVLIRGLEGIPGPGRVGKSLQINKSFYGEDLFLSERVWVENSDILIPYRQMPRVGIHYAGEPWISKPWRYMAVV
jgi:DNA-3-methyladenine glycosylase